MNWIPVTLVFNNACWAFETDLYWVLVETETESLIEASTLFGLIVDLSSIFVLI
ncbi:hypothetical protein [Mesoplasma melaleucae]|uniref:hypothetical protein n=1 Tax=Mesoplasma melaleucae TaxID=81459 RepID=UPI0012EBF853|nr:hypothetical protein [Mesoplasma melaleucae]